MHSKGTIIEFVPYGKTNEVVHELFDSLLSRYQIGFRNINERGRERERERERESNFIFDSVELLYYNRGGSYIDSEDWIKKKKCNNKF